MSYFFPAEYELFFFCRIPFFFKTTHGMKFLFLCSHNGMEWNGMEWREVKPKKVACHSSFPHFPLSAMHEVVGEAVLLNNFFQNSLATEKAAHEAH
jgi:hypothetical protein